MKKTFSYVSGGDFSAMTFSERYSPQDFYEEMIKNNVTETVINDENYIEMEIVEYETSDESMNFVRGTFLDYDNLKGKDLFEVKGIS